jgi:hypothetical protein
MNSRADHSLGRTEHGDSRDEDASVNTPSRDGGQLHLVFPSAAQEGPRRTNAHKLTVTQRHALVCMRREGRSRNAVAQRFGVSPSNVDYLVGCGRYGGVPAPASHVELASSENNIVDDSRRRATRKGVDLIIRGLPLANHRTLERLAGEAGCSVADFTLDLLACAAPPTAPEPARTVQRVGLRHLMSTWRTEP